MIIRNKIDRTFGPFGTSTGFCLLLGGIIAAYFSLYAIIIAVIGAFAAFTSTNTVIDTDIRKIRHSDNLFGIFPAGKLIDIRPGMKLRLTKGHRGFVGYIRGNQPVDIHEHDIRITLIDENRKPILPVRKFKTYESARNELDNLSLLLGLPAI